MKLRAVVDARRDRHTQPPRNQRVTAALARPARFRPCFASAAALLARRAKKNHHRNNGTTTRFAARETDLRSDRLAAFAEAVREKRSTHTGHEVGDRRKIDRDLISEAIRLAFKSHAG